MSSPGCNSGSVSTKEGCDIPDADPQHKPEDKSDQSNQNYGGRIIHNNLRIEYQ